MEYVPPLFLAGLSWLMMGRSLVAAATLLTFLPFISLDLDSMGVEGLQDVAASGSLFKATSRTLGAGLFILLALTDRRVGRDLLKTPSILAAGFVVWALVGISNSANPGLSLLRIAEWSTFYLGAVVIHSKVTRPMGDWALSKFFVQGLAPLVLTVLYYSLVNPELTVETRAIDQLARLGGLSMDPNSIGLLGAILGIVGITALRARREGLAGSLGIWPTLLLVLALYLIVATRSRSAVVAFMSASCALGIASARRSSRSRLQLFIIVTLVAILIPFFVDGIMTWILRGEDLVALQTGTGRKGLWVGLLSDSFPTRPILGHGYMMLSETGRFLQGGSWWNNAHNAYLFALISTGLVGLALILAMVSLGVFRWFRPVGRDLDPPQSPVVRQGLAACYLALLVDAMASYGMVGHPSPAMFLFHILYVRASIAR